EPEVERVEYAVMRVGRVVAAVLDETRGQDSDAHRLGVQRNEQRVDVQRANAVAAIGKAVERGVRLRYFGRKLHGALLALSVKGAYIARIAIEGGEGECQLVDIVDARRGVAQQEKRVDARKPAAEADRLPETPEIEAAHVERNARAESGGSGGRVQAAAA